jgi:hypothetical protein
MITLSWIDLAFLIAFSACIGAVVFGLVAHYRQLKLLATGKIIPIAFRLPAQKR